MKVTYAATSVAAANSWVEARLGAQATAYLDYPTTTSGLGVSEAVRASLAFYHQAKCSRQARKPFVELMVGV